MCKPIGIRHLFLAANIFVLIGTPGLTCEMALLPRHPEDLAKIQREDLRHSPAIALVKTARRHRTDVSGMQYINDAVVIEGWKGLHAGEKLKIYNRRYDKNDCSYFEPAPAPGKTALLIIEIDQRPILAAYPSLGFSKDVLEEYRDRWIELERIAVEDSRNPAKWMALAAYLDDWNDLRNAVRAYSQVLKFDPTNREAKLRLADLDRRRIAREPRFSD